MRLLGLPDQVLRLALLFAVAIVVLVLVRQRFVPESFGRDGHYRAEAIPIAESLPTRYAGADVCVECHEDQGEIQRASYHRDVPCETCHGAAQEHVDDPEAMRPNKPIRREDCLICHRYLPPRPSGFPQVIENSHNPGDPCITCHDPHDPTPPETPTGCAGCHATIARTKAVSHHAALACETCHTAEADHFTHPRAHLPTKPTERQFCGQCHARSAEVASSIPRVEMQAHGDRYVCWQCHYSHSPEGS